MLKKTVSLGLTLLLMHVSFGNIVASIPAAEKEAARAARIKAGISKIGTGANSRVKVKLRDGTRLEGYLSAAHDDSFVLTDTTTGAATTIPYPQVKQVKGHNLSTGAKIAIGVGLAVAVIAILYAVADKDFTN